METAVSSVARRLRRNINSISTLKRAADEHGVADVGNRGPHQVALVVDGRDLDARRGRLPQLGDHGVELAGNRQGVASQPAKDGHGDGVLSVGADRRGAVFVGDDDTAHVGHADRSGR